MAQVRINDEIHRKLKAFVEKRLGSMGEWVNKWVREGLRRETKAAKRKVRR